MTYNLVPASDVSTGGPQEAVAGKQSNALAHQSLLAKLNETIETRGNDHRTDSLRRVTDLFVARADHLGDEQRAVFDDVMRRLAKGISAEARADFAARLATIIDAPPEVCRALALDSSIEVAGPLLKHCQQLDDATLIISAKTKNQEHLFAISQRIALSEPVTDILVTRGNRRVVESTAGNNGARFSEFGYSTLITRAGYNDELALTIWVRPEIPRRYLLAMFARASQAVQFRLQAADPKRATHISEMLAQGLDEIQRRSRSRSPEFAADQSAVKMLYSNGTLTDDRIRDFAENARFEQTIVALSLLSGLSSSTVERTLASDDCDELMIVAKTCKLSWQTTRAILIMISKENKLSAAKLEILRGNFKKLNGGTASEFLRVFRSSDRSDSAEVPPHWAEP
jgi:uncharacterized protein (DUF2336 family)